MLKLLCYASKQLLLLSLKDNIFCGGAVALDKKAEANLSQGAPANRDKILKGR
jgi:hypothetical protein